MIILLCFVCTGIVPDPCLSEPCDVNAVCEREGPFSDNFTCTCQPPFTEGNGFNCSSISLKLIIIIMINLQVVSLLHSSHFKKVRT